MKSEQYKCFQHITGVAATPFVCELVWCDAGYAVVRVGGRTHRVNRGTLSPVPEPGTGHRPTKLKLESTDMAKFTLPTATTKPATAAVKETAKAAKLEAKKPEVKAAKAAPATKTKTTRAPRPNGTGGRAAFAGFPVDAKITVLSKEHDFNSGSIRAKAFEGILKAKTVAEARTASNGDPWHLRTAVAKRQVKVAA